MNINGFADTSKARKHLRAIGNNVGSHNAADMAAGYKFGTLIKYQSLLELQLESIRVQVCASDRV